jgi:PIN domain nuclease of toxin-antitoxin system
VAVLLDTHTLLWWTQDDPKLSKRAREAILGTDRYCSLASCWKLAIKVSLDRLRFDRPLAQFLDEQLFVNTISLLPIEFRHVMRVSSLPLHHRDPFDRLLIAQALEENLAIVSIDRSFDVYGIERVW